MKKSLKLKRKTIKLLAKNLIVFAVLIAVTIVGVRSWFHDKSTDPSAKAADLSVECTVPEGLEIAIVAPGQTPTESDWKKQSFTINDTDYPFLVALSLADITSDGKTFISPPIYQKGAVATVHNTKFDSETTSEFNSKWSNTNIATTPNVEYFSVDLYMRCTASGQKAVLDSATYFGPPTSTNDFGNKVSGYSPDAVIGAARMSIYDSSITTRKLLWVPAPHLYFDGVDLFNSTYKNTNDLLNTGNTFGLFYTENNTSTNIHTDGTYNHGYYTGSKTHQKINRSTTPGQGVTSNTTKDYLLHTDVDLANLTTRNGNYYQNSVRINIWVEGEDPESRAAQISGQFKAIWNLKLASAS